MKDRGLTKIEEEPEEVVEDKQVEEVKEEVVEQPAPLVKAKTEPVLEPIQEEPASILEQTRVSIKKKKKRKKRTRLSTELAVVQEDIEPPEVP